jgi:hypothetical protein
MKWTIEYSRRANDFIEEQDIQDKVTSSLKDFILRMSGSNINIDVKNIEGRLGRLLPHPKGERKDYHKA